MTTKILFYNAEPIAHSEDVDELIEIAWEKMGRAGFAADELDDYPLETIDDFRSWFKDCIFRVTGVITPGWNDAWMVDGEGNDAVFVIFDTASKHEELGAWGGRGDLIKPFFDYCEENGIDSHSD